MAKCCFDYVWWEQFLGQFQDGNTDCPSYYLIGDQNTFGFGGTLDTVYLNGNPYAIGLDYTNQAGVLAALQAAVASECGGDPSEVGFVWSLGFNFFYLAVRPSSGCLLTQLDYTDDFATPQTSTPPVEIACGDNCYTVDIVTDGGPTPFIPYMTIFGNNFYMDSASTQLNDLPSTSVYLQNYFYSMGINISNFSLVALGGPPGSYRLSFIANAIFNSVAWNTNTPASGTDNFSSC